jgi:uncharacterized protein YcfJ
MNRLVTASLLAFAALGTAAVQGETFFDNARVRSAEPQYENVAVPRTECRSEWVQDGRHADGQPGYGGAVVGGVAGALLGNQVGGGHGKEAATAVGAVVGALTGDRIANGDRYERRGEAREVKKCWTVTELQPRITGYRVQYEYRGQQYATMLRENPGPTLQVRISVDPVQRY